MADSPRVARRRRLYRPAVVNVLLIGESAPAQGTHFYLANSNLFNAVHDAFARVYGTKTPDGDEFLGFFRDRGYWLVDLADEPVNHLHGAARRERVERGVPRVARTIRETRPSTLVDVVKSIIRPASAALDLANHEAMLVALPFPVMGWQAAFVDGLAKVLRRQRRRDRPSARPSS